MARRTNLQDEGKENFEESDKNFQIILVKPKVHSNDQRRRIGRKGS
jgi:hypothetical protein